MAAFEKELNKLDRILKHLEEILDESVDYKLTQEKVIEEIVGIKDDLHKLQDVAELIMPPSIGQKALEHIESANCLIARISREWDLPNPAAEGAMMSIQQKYNKWDSALKERYFASFKEDKRDNTIWDGVISPEKYAEAPMKVMILNREAYDPEPDNPYDLCEAIRDRIKNNEWVFPNQNTLRTHLKQYLKVLNMGQNGYLALSDETVREHVQSADYYEFLQMFERVAYCNVKKSDGKPKSSKKDLKVYAEKGLDTLKNQILFFNPSIILAGDVCDDILDNLFDWGDNLFCDPNHRVNIWQVKIGDILFPYVDMFHPSLVKGMSEYYIELLHALQVVEREHPGFWRDQIEKTKNCFITQ